VGMSSFVSSIVRTSVVKTAGYIKSCVCKVVMVVSLVEE
jgi:hypothetical protein